MMLHAYERHPDAFTSTPAERAALPIDWWRSRLSDAPLATDAVFGAFDGGALAGVAGLAFEVREKTRHKCTLFGMYVADDLRRSGAAGALLAAALAYARSRAGMRLVQLTVSDGNHAAQRLYERYGFARFGVEPLAMAIADGFVAKVHMWCDLDVDPIDATSASGNAGP